MSTPQTVNPLAFDHYSAPTLAQCAAASRAAARLVGHDQRWTAVSQRVLRDGATDEQLWPAVHLLVAPSPEWPFHLMMTRYLPGDCSVCHLREAEHCPCGWCPTRGHAPCCEVAYGWWQVMSVRHAARP
ncbi:MULTISPECIES: hypothetical protein [Pseudonocardia]|uniref:Uncharacterized protein n=1 Tax=Pseudonocardia alni TaxID=33907 RepID=A0A852WJ09_PSEA5|nr:MULTISPECIES: hypothetical protein [Pseudonocardia]MCO7192195.1 hypothetical protein [Pseudonocardia sp. McavD-2-B]NYG05312.1 hypothetical protein [Pseudonocardia antarctica]PKB41342.1 hypothetical protein ATL51_0004 [Pseudonocardia alni]